MSEPLTVTYDAPSSPSASDAGSLDSVASVSFGATPRRPAPPGSASSTYRPGGPEHRRHAGLDQGEGLDAALAVSFGGVEATVTAVVSAQLLKCLSPPCEMGGASEKRWCSSASGDARSPRPPFTTAPPRAAARARSGRRVGRSLSPADIDEPALKRRVVSVLEAAADRMGGGTGGTGGVTAADDAPADDEYSAADAAADVARLALRARSGGVGLGHLLGALGMNRELALLLCLPGASWDERDPAGPEEEVAALTCVDHGAERAGGGGGRFSTPIR